MTDPRYQDVKSGDIPQVIDDDGTRVKIICGDFWGKSGPVDGIAANPRYLDVFVPAGVRKVLPADTWQKTFAYVFEGSGAFADASDPGGILLEKEVDGQEIHVREQAGDRSLVMFGTGDEIVVQAGEQGIRFLLVSGAPIEEPVAWHGPIVMNTRDELQTAIRELNNGSFIKKSA
jgi:redox-sensitive bicupin YhaK (pirin superfamily)